MKLASSLVVIAALLCAAAPVLAQTRTVMTIDGENAFLLEEFICVLAEQDGRIVVSIAPQAETLKKEYGHVDLQQGDVVRMMNGTRVRTTAEMRKLYDGLSAGDEVKLGVRRGDELFIVSFPRAEPAESDSGAVIRRIVVGGDGEGEVDEQ